MPLSYPMVGAVPKLWMSSKRGMCPLSEDLAENRQGPDISYLLPHCGKTHLQSDCKLPLVLKHRKYGQQSNPHSLFVNSLAGPSPYLETHISFAAQTAAVSAYPPSTQNMLEGAAIAAGSCCPQKQHKAVALGLLGHSPRKNLVSPLATRLFAEVGYAAGASNEREKRR